jgi:phosphatidylethanolamine/phosphatidyl-N-methylethanolamine N-methyltransferase
MPIFEQQTRASGDAATRALSVTNVGTDFVEKVYQNIAQVYDYTYGPTLHPGRLEAIKKMRIRPGTQILEVGVGTGINLSLYPKTSNVTGIDLSSKMLAKAQQRIDEKGLSHCQLMEMDATKMKFADNSYDVVYAPYVISVVPDPVAVAREMYRVCRPGGRVVILNHFKSANPLMSKFETAISPMTVHIGFTADLDLPGFLEQADLNPVSIEKVNVPKIWTLITVVKD